MEKEIKIKTKDGKYIYGTLGSASKKSEKLVVFVHGFTGHRNEHIHFNGAQYFKKKGFDTFRFDLYGDGKGARLLRDTKISLHGEDITTVLKYFKKSYKKIHLVGHSFGGTSILFADTSLVSSVIMWDASYIEWSEEEKDFPYNKAIDAYTPNWGVEYIIGKEFVEELKHFPDCGEMISKITVPIKFITAGNKGNMKAGKKYFAKSNQPKEIFDIKTADHCFNNPVDETKLFDETYAWLKKY